MFVIIYTHRHTLWTLFLLTHYRCLWQATWRCPLLHHGTTRTSRGDRDLRGNTMGWWAYPTRTRTRAFSTMNKTVMMRHSHLPQSRSKIAVG